MIAFLFAILLIEENNEGFAPLTPMEIQQIDELPAGDRLYALYLLSEGPSPKWRDHWLNVRKGEFFFAPNVIKIEQIMDESSFTGANQTLCLSVGDTSRFQDDILLDTRGAIFFCDGNRQFTNIQGAARTLMNVVLIQPEDSLDLLKAIAEPRGYRVWGEGTRRLKIEKYIRSTSKSVTILSVYGSRSTIKRKTLTPADEEWVSKQEEDAAKQKKDAAK